MPQILTHYAFILYEILCAGVIIMLRKKTLRQDAPTTKTISRRLEGCRCRMTIPKTLLNEDEENKPAGKSRSEKLEIIHCFCAKIISSMKKKRFSNLLIDNNLNYNLNNALLQ